MNRNFESDFMDIQSDLISLCLEVTQGKVDKVYAYASIEEKSMMFNAFFEKEGSILTLNQLNIDKRVMMDFLRIGTMDLEKVKRLCKENETKSPTEIKMYYDIETGKYNADYNYNEICSARTGMSSGEVFMNWYNEIRNSAIM